MNRVIRKSEQFSEKSCTLNETLFHNANGYIGVRGCLEEGVPEGWDTMRGMYINGFYDIIPMKQAENLCNFVEEKQTMLNVADTQTILLSINGEQFNLGEGTVLKNDRVLDMDRGYTAREIEWESPGGKRLAIYIKRMASFEQRSLFAVEYKVLMLKGEGSVRIESKHIANVTNYCNPNDPRLASESEVYLRPEQAGVLGNRTMIVSRTQKSGLGMCSAVSNSVHSTGADKVTESTAGLNEGEFLYTAELYLREGEDAALTKYTVLTDSVRDKNFERLAKEELERAVQNGMEFYSRKQEEFLARFWHQSEMEILGDEQMNLALNFNMYQLLQSAARDSYCNIAAKGLSGEGYEGHYFWDTEMFLIPFFTLTNPEITRTLLSYRYAILGEARNNAALLGHTKGALYPWRTITGVECSGYFPSGTAQYHINGDIAYAIVQYYLTVQDDAFMVEQGAEMMLETARLWMDVGNYDNGKFVIHCVTGPDEYTCMVNNNYYTNCSAKYNLEWAVKFYQRYREDVSFQEMIGRIALTEDEIDGMEKAAKLMYLPYDSERDINPQDDSFLNKPVWNLEETPENQFPLLLHYHPLHLYRYQVCKQADVVLAYFLYEEQQKLSTMQKSYEYYEQITTHDSSLSTCVFSIVASRLGMRDKAYRYFGDSAKLDLENTHNNTKDGIHTANMGGCYMAMINGFAGLRITECGISVAPFLPEAWSGYRFKFRYRGSLLRVCVEGNQVSVSVLEGTETLIKIMENTCVIRHGETVSMELAR